MVWWIFELLISVVKKQSEQGSLYKIRSLLSFQHCEMQTLVNNLPTVVSEYRNGEFLSPKDC